jgi:hypothetical protein
LSFGILVGQVDLCQYLLTGRLKSCGALRDVKMDISKDLNASVVRIKHSNNSCLSGLTDSGNEDTLIFVDPGS